MYFQLEVGGRVRRLRVERRNGHYEVDVDHRAFVVDARQITRDTVSMLVGEGDGPVRSVDATVAPRSGSGTLEISLAGHLVPASPLSRFGAKAADEASGTGPQQVLAPMPGKVVHVLVAAGDLVEPRQGLVVIEAMKMENELRAARAGRVRSVRVAEGQSVEAGALLVTVESDP
jgi:biotin carboxyl carrier protein